MTTQPLLLLESVSRHYQSGEEVLRALDQVSLGVYPGEFVAIMGQSGSGKSTLMNILGCLDTPTEGVYQVRGTAVNSLDSDSLAQLRCETFGFIFQRYNLLSTITAAENVELPGIYAGIPAAQRKQRARALLDRLGLKDRVAHRPNELSGGQQQRVAIARALINDPPVLLADEPTGALDSKSSEQVLALLQSLHREGRTIVLITHEESVAAHAQRIIRIQDGAILSDQRISAPVSITRHREVLPELSNFNLQVKTSEAIKMAFRSLRTNLFRTALTLLGIVIGVAAVITMLAIGNGSKERVLREISSLGTNLLSVRPGAPGMRARGEVVTLRLEDALALQTLEGVEAVSVDRSTQKTLRVDNIDHPVSVQGVSADFPRVREWPLAHGVFFSEADMNSYAPVIVLGSTVETVLFPDGRDPLGEFVLVGTIPFEVIGVMKEKGAAPWGGDQDDTVFVPVTTGFVRIFGSSHLGGITIKVREASLVAETEEAVTVLLTERHRVVDFQVRNTAAYMEMAAETQNTLTVLLGAVAAISLIVGGIGVMNIMLVSVTERTREIGIRMATGARIRDILLQFNSEAGVVCTIGGLIGVGFGLAAGGIASGFGLDVQFSFAPIVLAFSSAVATGLLFGYLPARKAAHLDPVVALSSE